MSVKIAKKLAIDVSVLLNIHKRYEHGTRIKRGNSSLRYKLFYQRKINKTKIIHLTGEQTKHILKHYEREKNAHV